MILIDVSEDHKYLLFSYCSSVPINTTALLKVTDLLGREAKGSKNEPLLYLYDDGTVEKRIVIE